MVHGCQEEMLQPLRKLLQLLGNGSQLPRKRVYGRQENDFTVDGKRYCSRWEMMLQPLGHDVAAAGNGSRLPGKRIFTSAGKYITVAGKDIAAAGKYVVAAGKYVVAAVFFFFFKEKGKYSIGRLSFDKPNLVVLLALLWKFLKNNRKRKDQMQREEKNNYTLQQKVIYVQ